METTEATEQRLVAAVDAGATEVEALLRELVRARSPNPPGDTRAPAAVVADYLADQGITAQVEGATDERPSVLAAVGQGPYPLLYLSHLDTVPLGRAEAWHVDPF